MAPVEFEKELQKRLRSRRIEPRADSWDRIEARLEAERPAGRRRSLYWKIGAAASIVCLLGYFLLRQPAREVPEGIPVVETPAPVTPDRPEAQIAPVGTETHGSPAPSQVVQEETRDRNPEPAALPPADAVAGNSGERPVILEFPDQPYGGVPSGLQDVEAVPDPETRDLASGGDMAGEVDDAEVDALLIRALEALEGRNTLKDTTAVNPGTLLDEAESELDQTFREQILKKLKMGFGKVRTGVADRSQ